MTPEEFRSGVADYPAGDILLTGHVETIRDAYDEPTLEAASIAASRRGFERTVHFPDPLRILPTTALGAMCRQAIENLTRNEEAFS